MSGLPIVLMPDDLRQGNGSAAIGEVMRTTM
jgi:hypothetical protein